MADRCMDLKESSATVALAALALGTEEARIAKTLSFLVEEAPVVIAVSYTHLDVYKRQVHGTGLI